MNLLREIAGSPASSVLEANGFQELGASLKGAVDKGRSAVTPLPAAAKLDERLRPLVENIVKQYPGDFSEAELKSILGEKLFPLAKAQFFNTFETIVHHGIDEFARRILEVPNIDDLVKTVRTPRSNRQKYNSAESWLSELKREALAEHSTFVDQHTDEIVKNIGNHSDAVVRALMSDAGFKALAASVSNGVAAELKTLAAETKPNKAAQGTILNRIQGFMAFCGAMLNSAYDVNEFLTGNKPEDFELEQP